jgi:hypothetical protein
MVGAGTVVVDTADANHVICIEAIRFRAYLD